MSDPTKKKLFPKVATLVFYKLKKLWVAVNSDMGGSQIKHHGDLRLLVLISITAGIHRLVRGILAEIQGNSIDCLDLVTRSFVEALINVKYILEDDTEMRARAYIVQDNKDRITALKRLIPLLETQNAPAMAKVTDAEKCKKLQKEIEAELTELETQHGTKNLIWPDLKQRAKKSNNEELYATAIWLLSLDTHLTARGLDRFIKEKPDGGVIVDLGQDLSRASLILTTIYTTYMALLNECSQRLGCPQKTVIKPFDDFPLH